jgi:hypothetical protein
MQSVSFGHSSAEKMRANLIVKISVSDVMGKFRYLPRFHPFGKLIPVVFVAVRNLLSVTPVTKLI